ncbi:thyrotropin receptor-like protein [Labeo rohita]|uniref:Thyrotropin receptor-like protein n=1 Tax=Labeo rohita TaxID=84645 RepID=A0A498NFB9_LABRO|nr:thyrotropin receptor-like protein [Labeo rohita]
MMDMLAQATERIGLEWKPPPCPEPLRLDIWYLRVARPTLVPFFLEVHDELTEMWMASFNARHSSNRFVLPHHPQWWHANVSKYHFHLAGQAVAALPGP